MKKSLVFIFSIVVLTFVLVSPVSAHVVVKPASVGVAAYQTFTMGVPNEKDVPTTAVRLLIPQGLKSVSPNVKPGWRIEVKKTGEGDSEMVTEILWTGGSIPVGQRDDFLFSAQAPSEEMTLAWKAYQTYQDGKVVAWDQDPALMKDHNASSGEESSTPFSVTKVINDLKAPASTGSSMSEEKEGVSEGKLPLILSGLALLLSIAALWMQFRRGK